MVHCRRLQPPLPKGHPIKLVGRTDSNAAAYALSQWLLQAGNHTWLGAVNKTLPLPPRAKAVSGSGSKVTDYIGSTPGAIGCASAHCAQSMQPAKQGHLMFGVSLRYLMASECAPKHGDANTLHETVWNQCKQLALKISARLRWSCWQQGPDTACLNSVFDVRLGG